MSDPVIEPRRLPAEVYDNELIRMAKRLAEVAPGLREIGTWEDVSLRHLAEVAYALGVELEFTVERVAELQSPKEGK